MGIYTGIDGLARPIKNLWVGVDGVAKAVKKVYAGRNGVAEEVFSSGVSVILRGAVNETLTLTMGLEAVELVTDAHGYTAATALPAGEYTVTGSVSGYSRNVKITGPGEYNAYPDGALFWYGNGWTEGDSLYDKLGGWNKQGWENNGNGSSPTSAGKVELVDDHIHATLEGIGYDKGYVYSLFGANSVDMTNWTTAKMQGHISYGTGGQDGIFIVTTTAANNYPLTKYTFLDRTNKVNTLDVSGLNGGHYIVLEVGAKRYGDTGNVHVDAYAVWME